METSQKDGENKTEMDDSGVQDVDKQMDPDKPAGLLDLSDDVLLGILKYCSPRDLKALGFTCPRLGRLICDRTLWTYVDTRAERTGRARLHWMIAHALGPHTVELKIQGYAKQALGCLGHTNRSLNLEQKPAMAGTSQGQPRYAWPTSNEKALRIHTNDRNSFNPTSSSGAPLEDPEDLILQDGSCPGPQFTLTQGLLKQLRQHCALRSLALECCNINCNTSSINHFPPTLKKLSLKGTKCYNLAYYEKSFLFNIQDYLPELEYLDVSECEWLEPASLLPLSKVANLKTLIMRECFRLAEFVAYASLATRYGFRKLEVLDVRGCPVADSEVSAFGWLPELRELYISPARCPPTAPAPPPRAGHAHYRDEPLPPFNELDDWEKEEPEYFKIKPQTPQLNDTAAEDSSETLLNRHSMEYENQSSYKRSANSMPDNIPPQMSDYGPKIIEVSLRNRDGQRTTPSIRVFSTAESRILREEFANIPNKRMKLNENNDNDSSNKTPDDEEKPGSSKDVTSESIDPSKVDYSDLKMKFVNTPGSSKSVSENVKSTKSRDRPGCSKDAATNTTFEEAGPSKRIRADEVNPADLEQPGCSKYVERTIDATSRSDDKDTEKDTKDSDQNEESQPKKFQFVRFRHDTEPEIVIRDAAEVEREQREREERERENPNVELMPRSRAIYVNVGQQLHTVYRLSVYPEPPMFYSFSGNSHLRYRPNIQNVYYVPPVPQLDAASLVTDSAVRRFGRADVEDIQVVHIGPGVGAGDPSARPNRSSLRILSITGFRNITDRSLVHLATAAPELRFIDFSDTRVTEDGVEQFKCLRPDCEVKFSKFVDSDLKSD